MALELGMLKETQKDSPARVWWKGLRREVPYSLPDTNLTGPKEQMNRDGWHWNSEGDWESILEEKTEVLEVTFVDLDELNSGALFLRATQTSSLQWFPPPIPSTGWAVILEALTGL